MNTELRRGSKRGQDSWDRFFDRVQQDYEDGRDISADLTVMINIMMSRDTGIRELLERHFEPEDYFFVKEHMIGTGMIGGKSCGMLTSRARSRRWGILSMSMWTILPGTGIRSRWT